MSFSSQPPLNPFRKERPSGLRAIKQTCKLEYRNLPFHKLSPFETVQKQYADWGLVFKDAIAILPSNASFFNHKPQVVLMPVAQRRSITISLEKTLSRLTLGVRGYRDIHLSVLDRDGHCISHCKTFRYRYVEHHKAPLEELTIEVGNAASLIIESSSPFTLESISI